MKNNNELKISIITPSYNSGDFIERAIKSVLSQDYKNWEHIVIDGGSNDNTIDILKKYKHLDWISEKDDGQADAMNKGFLKSKGDIIVYLNADDYFFPGAFNAVISEFKKGAKFVVGNVLVKSPRLKKEFLNVPRITLRGMMKHWEPNAFCHNPVGYFYIREVQENCPFNSENYATMDLEFLLDAVSKYKFSKVDFTLGCFEDGLRTKTGVTQSKLDYWKPSTFPYLQKYLNKLSIKEKKDYETDRRNGYILMQEHMNKLNNHTLKLIHNDKYPLVSVIIPTYNCEKYICRAIESVLEQDFDNIEIIIVDDASTDNTRNIIKKYYENNNEVKIIFQSENQKQGAARNSGLDKAKGKYIFFLDADDWIDRGCLKHLCSIAETYDSEVVACGVNKTWENGRKEFYHGYSLSCDDFNESMNYLIDYKIGTIVWNKLYLRDFIERNKLRFIVPHWHEDVSFSFKAFFLCKSYISISKTYYNYFQRSNSTINKKQTLLHLESYLKLYIDIINLFEENKANNRVLDVTTYRKLLNAHCLNFVYPQLIRYAKSKNDWREDLISVCMKMLGVSGLAVADFVIAVIEEKMNFFSNLKKDNCSKKSKKVPFFLKLFINVYQKIIFTIFSPYKFIKKYFNLLLNSKLRQPARKVWYFVRGKKIIK
ncbi:MAG: glycosyltransferase [Candidatus Moranbacteria bacterium]|jgi:glycosyltransferase involved in cell wall biosynthesis|nr:glycosyltransferase [Candidatus Moranbacteria bacterium]